MGQVIVITSGFNRTTGLDSAANHPASDFDAAGSATTALATAQVYTDTVALTLVPNTRTVNGQALSSNVSITSVSGNAGTATALANGRTFSVSTDATGTSGSFDGTGDATIPLTLATVNSNVGSFTNSSITVNAKGLVTAASSGAASGLTIGTTTITSGTSGRVLYDNAGVVGEMTTTGTGTQLMLAASPTTTGTLTGAIANWSGAQTISVNGALSAPGFNSTGTWITGGTSTTCKPYALIEPSGTTSTGWPTTGCGLGLNAPSGFTGSIQEWQLAGVSQASISSAGAPTFGVSGGSTSMGITIKGGYEGFVGNHAGWGFGIHGTAPNSPGFVFDTGGTNTYPWYNNAVSDAAVNFGRSDHRWLTLFATLASISNVGGTVSSVVTIAKGAASQTADLWQGQKSDATVYSSIGATGYPKFAGSRNVAADVTNATATMANIKTLVDDCLSGVTYTGTFDIPASDSVALDGLQFDFNGGSATFSSVKFWFVGTPVGATLGVSKSDALGTAITATTATTGAVGYAIRFAGVCNGAGTLIVRGAQVAHTTGTATFEARGFSNIQASF